MNTFIKSAVVICLALFTTSQYSADKKFENSRRQSVWKLWHVQKRPSKKAANVKGKSNAVWDA
ncbi:MAG: hypothetical protein IPL63_12200, partial [Saprospiraceae bacterium]|nr:hypothetical protein [Saprospiraceae bacterium]